MNSLTYMPDCYLYPWRMNRGAVTVLWLTCCSSYHLTAFALFLHSLSSLISNCLSLLFGFLGRPVRLKPFSCKQQQQKTWDIEESATRKYPRGPVQFQSHESLALISKFLLPAKIIGLLCPLKPNEKYRDRVRRTQKVGCNSQPAERGRQ